MSHQTVKGIQSVYVSLEDNFEGVRITPDNDGDPVNVDAATFDSESLWHRLDVVNSDAAMNVRFSSSS